MNIAGYNPNSFVDYPKKLSAVIFIGGCNFDCWYCHNRHILSEKGNYCENIILESIKKNLILLDAVTITGGEPTCEKKEDLLALIKKIKQLNLSVKLDTNGTNPKTLNFLKEHIDYIAMDIKAPLDKYKIITPINNTLIKNIKESIEIIKNHPDYEFRTTFTPDLTKDDIIEIAKTLKGAKSYYLQHFRPVEQFKDNLPHSPEYLKETALAANNYLPTFTRGV